MKKLLFIFSVAGLLLASCGGNTQKKGVHTHEDGTVHSDDAHSHDQAKPDQESYEVKEGEEAKECNHKHDGECDHKHDKKCDDHKDKDHDHDHDHNHDHDHDGDHKH